MYYIVAHSGSRILYRAAQKPRVVVLVVMTLSSAKRRATTVEEDGQAGRKIMHMEDGGGAPFT